VTAITEAVPERRSWLGWIAAARAWLFLILLLVFFEVWAESAYSTSFLLNLYNLQSIAIFAVAPLLLALGQTLVIISGGIDLSVGFVMGLAAVVTAHVVNLVSPQAGPVAGLLAGAVAAFAVAAIPGLINGVLIARLKVPPFIGTLGMYGVARGTGFLVAGGTTVPVNNAPLAALGNGTVWIFPTPVLITILIVAFMHYLLSQTRFGEHVYAIGGNRQAARRAGIQVDRNTLALYVIAALSAAAAGVLYTARFTAGAAQAGEPLLLDSIAAVVIGGASLFGGSGTIIGTVIGALIIAVIQFGLVFINVEPFWQFVAVGVVIVISVMVDQSQRRLTEGTRDE
jgi:ribose transport system permease protein